MSHYPPLAAPAAGLMPECLSAFSHSVCPFMFSFFAMHSVGNWFWVFLLSGFFFLDLSPAIWLSTFDNKSQLIIPEQIIDNFQSDSGWMVVCLWLV